MQVPLIGYEVAPEISLYVYESVELELGLVQTTDKVFEYPILLQEDPTSPARYDD